METKPLTLKDLFRREVRFVVPLFQRQYVWDRDLNWQPLWKDVETTWRLAEEDGVLLAPHFLGAVVLDLVKGATGTTESRQVIDGQQRLTTLQLLLAATRDVGVKLSMPENLIKSLRKLTINDDEMSSDPDDVFKVWPTTADRAAFRDTLSAGSATEVTKKYPDDRPTIVQAYLYFCGVVEQWLAEKGDHQRQAFDRLVYVLNHHLQTVVIDLGERDNPQVIFESLNARGTPLQASDLIRNYLFHEADKLGLHVKQLYDQHWARFDDGYWRKEVSQGRLNRPRMDAFIAHFLTMELMQEIPAHQLYLTFQRYVRNSDLPLPALMAKLALYGDIYKSLDTRQGLASAESELIGRLGVLDTSVVIPVLLLIFGARDNAARMPVLAALESYLVRRMLCRLTSKNYNRLLLDLLKRLAATPDDLPQQIVDSFLAGQTVESNYWPSDEDVRRAIGSMPLYKQLTRARVRMLLDLANKYQQTSKTEQLVYQLDKLWIEHLMPQSWNQHWPLTPSDEAGRVRETRERESLLHTLGNLTMTTQRLNQTISNGPWAAKRLEILTHSALNLNRMLPEDLDPAAIAARGRQLADTLCSALPRPAGSAQNTAELPVLGSDADDETDGNLDGDPEIGGSHTRKPRRDVGAHIVHVLSQHPVGTVLTVSQIATIKSAEYPDADVSVGAISQRLRAGTTSGVETTTNPEGKLAATLVRIRAHETM